MLLLLLICLVCINGKRMQNWQERYILSVLEWQAIVLLLVYGLSLMGTLRKAALLICLLVIELILLVLIIKFRTFEMRLLTRNVSLKDHWIYIIPLCMIMIAVYFAIITVPYNWDSMTYHLPRIAHWTQNANVFAYATHNDRQIGSTTLASYVCLMVYILSNKKDILLNLVQCMAYATNAVMVYSIARKCNVNIKLSTLASVLYLAMPIAFAEATTTQNDNFSTMWLLFFIYLILDYNDIKNPMVYDKYNRIKIGVMAGCMAMGYLSKPSVCFAMLIFLIWTLVCAIQRKDDFVIIVKLLGIGFIVSVVLILPQVIQNIVVFGQVSPANVGARQLVGTLAPNYLFIGFLKNFTYNLANSFMPAIKEGLSVFLYFMADCLQVNLDDPSIAEDGGAYGFSSYPYGCDTALNSLVLVGAIIGIIWCLIRLKKQQDMQKKFCISAMLSYIVFCVFLRWQPFISRYMIGYFALFCPLIAIQIQDFISIVKNSMSKKVISFCFFFICLVSYVGVIKNVMEIDTKDWPKSYFYHVGYYYNEYEEMCDIIMDKNYKEIGLITGANSYEYPLWGILNRKYKDFTIKHINVEGELQKFEDLHYTPECIMTIDRDLKDIFEWNGQIYTRINSDAEYEIYLYVRSDIM